MRQPSRMPYQQKTQADCAEKGPAGAVEPAAHLGAREPPSQIHAGSGIERDRKPLEYEEARAENRELRQHRLRDIDELRQERRENQNGLGIACGHEKLM